MDLSVKLLLGVFVVIIATELHGVDARETDEVSGVPMGFQQDISSSDSAALATTPIELQPKVQVLDSLDKSDEYALAMMSLSEGGRLSQCRGRGNTYIKLRNVDNMNAIARSPPYDDMKSPEDVGILFANHETVANVFPATAVLFANHSNCADAVSFRLYTVKLHDLISKLEDPDLMYKMEVTSVLETVGNQTYSVPVEYLFENGPVTFPAGTMMIDLIDIDDERVTDERKHYTLEHMSKSGELAYNADKYAVKAMGGKTHLLGHRVF